MRVHNLLPIGSVVLLRDGEQKLMIIGVMQQNKAVFSKRHRSLTILEFYTQKGMSMMKPDSCSITMLSKRCSLEVTRIRIVKNS